MKFLGLLGPRLPEWQKMLQPRLLISNWLL
jgi:hypothetical protein